MAAKKREQESAPQSRIADYAGPAAIGWVIRYDGTGYRRCRVRIPLDLLDEVRTGPESGPDLRANQAAWVQRETMTDEVLHAMHRDAKETSQ